MAAKYGLSGNASTGCLVAVLYVLFCVGGLIVWNLLA